MTWITIVACPPRIVGIESPLARRGIWPALTMVLAITLCVAGGPIAKAATEAKGRSAAVLLASQRETLSVETHHVRHGLKPGMAVIDRHGSRVGLIAKIHQVKDGRPAVSILVNGTPITVRKSKLKITRAGEEAIILLTPSQIRTDAILNTF